MAQKVNRSSMVWGMAPVESAVLVGLGALLLAAFLLSKL
jgi:hypothetical protein